jgi:hypothetical protein
VSGLEITRHAEQRMSQRGLVDRDIDLIMLLGTEVGDGFVVLEKDCTQAACALRRLAERIERLPGKRLVAVDGQLVTVYEAHEGKMRRLLQRDPDRPGRSRARHSRRRILR